MNEILVVIQGTSALALLKLCIDLGKILQRVESHEKRLDKIEEKI
jgi:hypothetical protein